MLDNAAYFLKNLNILRKFESSLNERAIEIDMLVCAGGERCVIMMPFQTIFCLFHYWSLKMIKKRIYTNKSISNVDFFTDVIETLKITKIFIKIKNQNKQISDCCLKFY